MHSLFKQKESYFKDDVGIIFLMLGYNRESSMLFFTIIITQGSEEIEKSNKSIIYNIVDTDYNKSYQYLDLL